jgi:uncharacterized protein with PQ loop repeat
MVQLIGYIGLSLLMMSCIPQTYKTVKQGHNNGMTVFYLVSLVIGFIVLIIYLCLLPKMPVPILINYIVNLICYSIMTYYKFFPNKSKSKERKQ